MGQILPKLTRFRSYKTRVYFEDTDSGGFTYHASYIRFAERARTEFLRESGLSHAELMRDHHQLFVVRNLSVSYQSPTFLDDLLVIRTGVLKIGGTSVLLLQEIYREDPAENGDFTKPAAVVEVLLVNIDTESKKPSPLFEKCKKILLTFLNQVLY